MVEPLNSGEKRSILDGEASNTLLANYEIVTTASGLEILLANARGKVRPHNEDSVGYVELPDGTVLAIVADGMGGADDGKLAAVGLVNGMLTEGSSYRKGVGAGQKKMRESGVQTQGERKGGACYAAARVQKDPNGEFSQKPSQTGDCRNAVMLRDGTIPFATRDRTIPSDLAAMGRIDESIIATHTLRNVITTVIGAENGLEHVEDEQNIPSIRLPEGSVVYIATDGVTRYVPEKKCVQILIEAGFDLEKALIRISKLAAESSDNQSIVLIKIPFPKQSGAAVANVAAQTGAAVHGKLQK